MEQEQNASKLSEVETPSLEEMLETEITGGVTFSSKVGDFLDNLSIPTTKDGKPDITALINNLLEGAKGVVKSHLTPDSKDPQWLPSAAAYQNILDTYQNAVENGRLRKEVKDALINLYESTAQQYIIARGQGRVNTSTLEKGKEFATSEADKTSNKYLIKLIEGAKTAEQVASRAVQVMQDLYGKAKQWYNLHGDLVGFKPAYAGAPAGNVKH